MLRWLLGVFVCMCSQWVQAQGIVVYTPRVQWTHQGRLVFDAYGQPLAMDREVKPVPMPTPSADDQARRAPGSKELVHAASGLHVFEDTEYATICKQEEAGPAFRLMARKEQAWQEVAILPHEPGYWWRTIFPLANGKFLVLSVLPFRMNPGEKNKGAYAAIYMRNEQNGKLSLVTKLLLKHDQWMDNPRVSNAFRYHFVTDSTITVACEAYGLFLVFSRKHGDLMHEVRLHEAVTDQWIRQGKAADVVLSMQPLKEGLLLIAGRPGDHVEDYIKAMDEHFQTEQVMLRTLIENRSQRTGNEVEQKKASENDKAILHLVQERRQQIALAYPLVAWFELNPDKGTIKSVNEPVGAYSLIESETALKNYFWLPETDGRIYYYSKDLKRRMERPGGPSLPDCVPPAQSPSPNPPLHAR